MWIYDVDRCIKERNIPVCIVVMFIFLPTCAIFPYILLYRNVNWESIEIFFHIKWSYKLASLLCKAIIKQLFVQLCCCFGDMIRMFYITDRHLKCIVHLKNVRCEPCKAYKLFNFFLKICQIFSVFFIKKQKQNEA